MSFALTAFTSYRLERGELRPSLLFSQLFVERISLTGLRKHRSSGPDGRNQDGFREMIDKALAEGAKSRLRTIAPRRRLQDEDRELHRLFVVVLEPEERSKLLNGGHR